MEPDRSEVIFTHGHVRAIMLCGHSYSEPKSGKEKAKKKKGYSFCLVKVKRRGCDVRENINILIFLLTEKIIIYKCKR